MDGINSNVGSPTKPIEILKYWTQHVLPTVYDDSLSYSELLNKVVKYLNDVIVRVNGLTVSFEELYNYVDNFFKNLDVQEEINNKLEEMLNSGKLNELLNLFIPYVTPQMFGAKGDGITDDTQAFTQALQNPYVIIPDATYMITDGITATAEKIVCLGKINFKPTELKRYFLLINNNIDIDITGINFEGNNLCGQCIWVVNTLKGNHLSIKGCTITNLYNGSTQFEPSGIYVFQEFINASIINNFISNINKVESAVGATSSTGITCNQISGNVVISNNHIENITTEYSNENNIFDCDAIRVGGNGNCLIENNYIYKTMGRGIKCQCINAMIINNYISTELPALTFNYCSIEDQTFSAKIRNNISVINNAVIKNFCHIRASAYASHTSSTSCFIEENIMNCNVTLISNIQIIKDDITSGTLTININKNTGNSMSSHFSAIRLNNINELFTIIMHANTCNTNTGFLLFNTSDIITTDAEKGNALRSLFKCSIKNNKNINQVSVPTLYPVSTVFYPYMFDLSENDYRNEVYGTGWNCYELGNTQCYYLTDGSTGGLIGETAPYQRYVYIRPMNRIISQNSSTLELLSSGNGVQIKSYTKTE